jgi:hypothetical protein
VPKGFGLYSDGVARFEPMDYRLSLIRRYFLGQTPAMIISSGNRSWGELYNPENSGVNLYVNVWTTSNLGAKNYTAEIYFGGVVQDVLDSELIACTHVCPVGGVNNIGLIRYRSNVTGLEVSGGINAFTRRVPEQTTIISVENGKYIIRPGERFGLLLRDTTASGDVRVAFGWWEVPIGEE